MRPARFGAERICELGEAGEVGPLPGERRAQGTDGARDGDGWGLTERNLPTEGDAYDYRKKVHFQFVGALPLEKVEDGFLDRAEHHVVTAAMLSAGEAGAIEQWEQRQPAEQEARASREPRQQTPCSVQSRSAKRKRQAE